MELWYDISLETGLIWWLCLCHRLFYSWVIIFVCTYPLRKVFPFPSITCSQFFGNACILYMSADVEIRSKRDICFLYHLLFITNSIVLKYFSQFVGAEIRDGLLYWNMRIITLYLGGKHWTMSKVQWVSAYRLQVPSLIFNIKEFLPFLPILLLCPCLTPLSCPSHAYISHPLEHIVISNYNLEVALSWSVTRMWKKASSMIKVFIGFTKDIFWFY